MEKQRIIGLGIIGALVIGGLSFAFLSGASTTWVATLKNPPHFGQTTQFSVLDLSKHNTGGDCYVSISGKVYDLSQLIGQHPQSDRAILPVCGKDATAPFQRQHAGSPLQADALTKLQAGVMI